MSKITSRIHILPTYLANQIAAGEVIERPASVMKELLENSLDAGATEIKITLEQGGTKLIRVQDNGCGVHPEDMLLTLSQHATSKIICSEDLAQIMTLGFRGEALASISAVSQFSLTAFCKDSEHAWQVSAQGREAAQLQPAAHALGTSVQVQNLFYNLPARRKFLRSARTEGQYTQEVIERILLSRFNVDFSIVQDEKKINRYPAIHDAAQHHTRVAKVLSPVFIEAAHRIDAQVMHLQLNGWVAPHDFTRSSNDWQYFYVNGRMVKDKLIQHAMRQAFAEKIHPGRYAAYVLYLTLDPTEVDVNVHPTKHEVRFQNTRLVHDFIVKSVQAALQPDAFHTSKIEHQDLYKTPTEFISNGHPRSRFARAACEHVKMAQWGGVPFEREQKFCVSPDSSHGPARKSGEYLTVLNNQLLISQTEAGLGVLDLHAYYAYQAARVLESTQDICRQPLLTPQTFKVPSKQETLLLQHHDDIQALGFVLDQMGDNTWLLREIPAILARADHVQLWHLLLNVLTDKTATHSEWIALLACAAIPAQGIVLSRAEIEQVLNNVDTLPPNARCPHGLNVWHTWSVDAMREWK